MKLKPQFYLTLITITFSGIISCHNNNTKSNLKSTRGLASTPSENLICEDLFSAACINSDGSLKDVTQEQNQDTSEILELAEKRALTAMGYSSIDEAMADRLSKAGIEASSGPDGLAFDLGLGVDDCETKSISGNNQTRHYAAVQKYFTSDLNDFLFSVAQKCADTANQSRFASINNNFSQCGDQLRLRSEVSEIYRLPDSEQRTKAEAFVIQNFNYVVPFKTEKSAEAALCDLAVYVQNNKLNQIGDDLLTEVQTSRPYVETVINSFYSPENVLRAQTQFDEVNRELKSIFSEINPNSPNAETFNSSMTAFSLRTVKKPPASDYRINENGTVVLKDETSFMESNIQTYKTVFGDLSSSYFYDLNAVYNSPVTLTANSMNYSSDSEVTMMPGYWGLLDAHPNIFYSTLAHEAGHKFSPSSTAYEGFGDLNSKFDVLFDCYRQNGSLNMSETMKDEVLADYISSEILARRLAKISDPTQRRKALIDAMGDMCSFENSHLVNGIMSTQEGDYPPNNHRCSGIYGANPNMRRLIGCAGESSKYKTCGLKLKPQTSVSPKSDLDADDTDEGTQ